MSWVMPTFTLLFNWNHNYKLFPQPTNYHHNTHNRSHLVGGSEPRLIRGSSNKNGFIRYLPYLTSGVPHNGYSDTCCEYTRNTTSKSFRNLSIFWKSISYQWYVHIITYSLLKSALDEWPFWDQNIMKLIKSALTHSNNWWITLYDIINHW